MDRVFIPNASNFMVLVMRDRTFDGARVLRLINVHLLILIANTLSMVWAQWGRRMPSRTLRTYSKTSSENPDTYVEIYDVCFSCILFLITTEICFLKYETEEVQPTNKTHSIQFANISESCTMILQIKVWKKSSNGNAWLQRKSAKTKTFSFGKYQSKRKYKSKGK